MLNIVKPRQETALCLAISILLFIGVGISCKAKEIDKKASAKKTSLAIISKKYFDLPNLDTPSSYSDHYKDFDVISFSGKVENLAKFKSFLTSIKSKKYDLIRIIDIDNKVIHLLIYDGKKINYYFDSTCNSNEFGPPGIVYLAAKQIKKEPFTYHARNGIVINKTVYYLDTINDKVEKRPILSLSKRYEDKLGNKIIKNISYKSVDLNGDGTKDKISFGMRADEAPILKVNDQLLEHSVRLGELAIVDINKKDRFKEIAIWNGDEEDGLIEYYYYNGKELVPMGQIEGTLESIKIDGFGTLATYTRSGFLHHWSYPDKYRLTEEHILVNVPQELYKMDYEVAMASDLPLQKSRTDTRIVITLKAGDKAKILLTDKLVWCLAQDKNGIKGWFAVGSSITEGSNNKNRQTFSNLNFAD